MILGTVSRSAPNTIVNPEQGASNAGAFVARTAVGAHVGFYPTAGAAKAAINAMTGGQLRWSREDMITGVEHYVARDTTLDPLDIAGSNLLHWSEVDANARILNAATQRIDLIGDRSGGSRSFLQPTTLLQGTLVQNAINGYRALLLSQPDAQRMVATIALSPPFTIIVVANYLGAGALASSLLSSDGASPWRIGIDVAGLWEYENSARANIAGGRADATPAMLTVRQEPTSAEFRVNRATVGNNGNNPGASTTITLGGATTSPSIAAAWGGRVAVIVALDSTDISVVVQVERYVQRRFGTP